MYHPVHVYFQIQHVMTVCAPHTSYAFGGTEILFVFFATFIAISMICISSKKH